MPSILIIGGGPAGLSAAIYAARANIPTTVLYKDGGALGRTEKIENYFGFAEPLSGPDLLARGRAQAARLGVTLTETEVTGIEYAEVGFPSNPQAARSPRTRLFWQRARRAQSPQSRAYWNLRGAASAIARYAMLSFTAASRSLCWDRESMRWRRRAPCCRSRPLLRC